MALNKATLEQDIKTALQGENWDDAASAIATAIDTFVKGGTVTVVAGIPVATAGSAAAQTGATTAPGTGTIS